MALLTRLLILAVPLAGFAQSPRINAVVNAASYADGGISPGMMITIFGADIGPPQIRHLAVGPDGRLVTELAGTRVLFDGLPAPLIYVSATQTAAVVPYEVVARVLVNIQVEYLGVRSTSIVKNVVPVSPGIFAADASGRGQGAMVSPNGQPNSTANPVRPGQNVEVYFTGEGLLQDLAPTGGIATGANATRNTFTAEVGGLPATVTYAGAAPGNVFGFAQANVTIPTNLPNGGNLPLVLRAGGVSTQTNITVAVEIPTPTAVTSVFLIHGLNQSASDMNAFRNTLTGPNGLNPAQYSVDAAFNFSDCTQNPACGTSCTLSNGAQRLAQHIINRNPPGDVVLVGYSLGGLLARDLIANNWSNILGRYRIRLVTLAAPMLGYPYTSFDSLASCGRMLNEMNGNWRVTTPPVPQLSGYLNDIVVKWRNGSFPGAGTWLAASGRFCATGVRGQTGCREANLRNDGVVCDDSAAYNIETPAGTTPSRRWQDPSALYAHTSSSFAALIFGCAAQPGVNLTLSDPPPGPLLNEILAAIRGTAPQAAPAAIDMTEILSMNPAEQAAYVRATIARDFPADRAEGLAVLLRNLPAVAVATLEEFIAGADDRDSVLVAKAAEWIAFAADETAARAIGRLSALDPRFAGLAGRAADHARHVRKIQ